MSTPNLQEAQNTLGRESAASKKRAIYSAGAATLLATDSGALGLFNSTTGFTFTLPAITANLVGTWFDFIVTATVGSGSHKVITDAGTTFLLGAVEVITIATASPGGFAFNGTTHIAILMNGTTTGGIVGTKFRVTAISPTQWMIDGQLVGSGTVATPASTT